MKKHATQILEELAKIYGKGKDADLARQLGVPAQTLYNWKARGTIDFGLVYAKCPDIEPHWLLTGEGPMLKGSSATQNEIAGAEKNTHFAKVEMAAAEGEIALTALQKVVALLERDNERMREEIAELKGATATYRRGLGAELKQPVKPQHQHK